MKKIFLSAAFALVTLSTSAQAYKKYSLGGEDFAGNTYSVVRQDSTLNPQKFINAKQWLSRTFPDYKDIVQFEDANSGKIVIKGLLPVEYLIDDDNANVIYYPTLRFLLSIDVKQDRYRLKFDDMIVEVVRKEKSPLGEREKRLEYQVTDYVAQFRKHDLPRIYISTAITDFLNSAVTSIEVVDDF